MSIMREISFVMLIFAPLFIAIPLTVFCYKKQAHVRLISGLYAVLAALVIAMVAHPFSIGDTYWRISFVTAVSMGIYASVWPVHRQWVRISFIASILLCGVVALILLYWISDGYRDKIRNPYNRSRESITTYLKKELFNTAASRTFPAGYIDNNSPVLTPFSASDRTFFESELRKNGYSWQILSRWHTPITGLYYVDRTPMRLWYPGGRIKDEIEKIEWRKNFNK